MNEEIRQQMRTFNISQWKLADNLHVSENTVNRWLRHDLTGEKRKAVLDAIEKCKEDQKKEG